jgi:pimeloyl-ACP methyl ester carboxylesterase
VIGTELQGHGHTADNDREFTLGHLADDVVGLLDHLGLERADLFGFSVGGVVALEVAVRHPGRVDRLVLASTRYRREGYRDDLVPPSEEDFTRMRAAHAAVNPHPGRFDEMMRKIGRVARNIPGWTDDELRGLGAPTLLVLGDDDFVRLENAVRMHEVIPDARLAVLPGTTHLDMTHRERLIGPMVAEFLSRG